MSTYEFKCKGCGEVFEASFLMGTCPEILECPNCKEEANRIFSLVGIKVKEGASPQRTSSSGKPPDAIPMGGGTYAVPRRDKHGNLVKLKDIKDANDLPKDMKELRKKRRDRNALVKEDAKKQLGTNLGR